MNNQPITTPGQAVCYACKELYGDTDPRERVVMITLKQNVPIKSNLVALGGWTSVSLDIRHIAKVALDDYATQVILLHTHSGSSIPSKADIEETRRVQMALKTLDITLLDHIVVGKGEYYSFTDEQTTQVD